MIRRPIFLFAAGLLLAGCGAEVPMGRFATPEDQIYRPMAPKSLRADGAELCDQPIELRSDTYDDALKARDAGGTPHPGRSRCYLSTYLVPGAAQWHERTQTPEKRPIAQPDRYTLSFVEMPETGSALRAPRQLSDLQAHLSAPGQQVVIVYVHGWRHDADIGNQNVRNFRTMLGFTRSALNQRCIDTRRYCDARLTGVYVSWRGRSFNEPTGEDASGTQLLAGALRTVGDRKRQSEKLALAQSSETPPLVGHVLRSIEGALSPLDQSDATADKMLTMGHSFGGNMLATWLMPQMVTAVKEHVHGQQMAPVLGDLTVLVNPAAEAWKWTAIQREMRLRAGIPDSVFAVNPANAPQQHRDAIRRWENMFAKDQRPTYIALTATGNWAGIMRWVRKDSATRYAFKAHRAVAVESPADKLMPPGVTRAEKATAIGHLEPQYRATGGLRAGPAVGSSHEFINNRFDIPAKDAYALSGSSKGAQCGSSQSGWLSKALARAGSEGRGWDSSYHDGQHKPLLTNLSVGEVRSSKDSSDGEVQFRHALYLRFRKNSQSVAQASSPFWNIRAFDTAINEHAGFVRFTAVCGINILWLDNATLPS
ncbi:hypothetical protein [Sulfitobacter sp. AS59]|uniref:hypothetical protein n=1 Tax=Sulfitobacter sp. AS59 TaxID=3135784 RepID=UPI00316BED32